MPRIDGSITLSEDQTIKFKGKGENSHVTFEGTYAGPIQKIETYGYLDAKKNGPYDFQGTQAAFKLFGPVGEGILELESIHVNLHEVRGSGVINGLKE